MKNLSIIINAVLAIAIGVLFFLHFKSNKKQAANPPAIVSGDGKSTTIVYVNIDSLQEKYDYYIETKKTLEAEQSRMENTAEANGKKFQQAYQDAQARVSTMSAEEAQNIEAKLKGMQETYVTAQQKMEEELSNKTQKFNKDLSDRIHAYLVEYNKTKNYQYILAYAYPSAILLANPVYDITNDIVEGMNEEYRSKKK